MSAFRIGTYQHNASTHHTTTVVEFDITVTLLKCQELTQFNKVLVSFCLHIDLGNVYKFRESKYLIFRIYVFNLN